MGVTFTEVLNLSISASWLVLAVAAVRFALKKAPKAFHCALWALVAVRLLCPVSFESELSLVPSREVIPESYLAMEPIGQDTPAVLDVVTNPVYQTEVEYDTETTVDRLQSWDVFATVVWWTGMGAMAVYALYSYLSLRLRVRMAGWRERNVWECDNLDSPFILGILRPRIYLPSNLDSETREHVLAHENAHLKRLDHLWKPLGFALLTVHWFNPVMWLGYILLCRDIELACDERVIKKLDKSAICRYSQALVACAVDHKMIAACPLAFGEVGVKGRIKSMLNYKKPGFWVLLTAAVLSVVVAVCFMTDPAPENPTIDRIREQDGFTITAQTKQSTHVMLYKHWLPENVLNGSEHSFEPDEIVVMETDTTRMYLESARMYGNELLLTFSFSHTLDESGEIILPYQIENGGRVWTADVRDNHAHDFSSDYPDAARMAQFGPEQSISMGINMDIYENADDYIAFELEGLNALSYVRSGSDLAMLKDRSFHVAEVLYTHPTLGFAYTPGNAPVYTVMEDLTLMGVTDSALWQEYVPAGKMDPVELSAEQFDGKFDHDGWTAENIAANLRRNNKAAWLCISPYSEAGKQHLFLLQKDGAMYLAILLEQGDVIADLFRLENSDAKPQEPVRMVQTYAPVNLDAFEGPYFQLSSDGTFTFMESMLSSYMGAGIYVLTEDELILKTSDGLYEWCFTVAGDRFIFDAERSDPVRYYPGPREYAELSGGVQFAPTVSDQYPADPLDEAIRSVILQENRTGLSEDKICVAAYRILDQQELCIDSSDGGSNLLTLYLYTVYREFVAEGTTLLDDGGNYTPAVLTFDVTDGSYVLTEYWTPTEGVSYSKFTETARNLLTENELEYRQSLEDQCVRQAEEWLADNLPADSEIGQLLDEICAYPLWSSAPGPYINTHPSEYERILELKTDTLRYCFEQFVQGEQMGLRGHIMAIVCQEIITASGEECLIEDYPTGQAWFNLFAEQAYGHLVQMSREDFEKNHPACAVALGYLGI